MTSPVNTAARPVEEMRAFLRRRDDERHQKLDARYAEAVSQFAEIAQFIQTVDEVKRIWQFCLPNSVEFRHRQIDDAPWEKCTGDFRIRGIRASSN